jgi:hypothetical protein
VDASITNAVNESKDVVRFLELGTKLFAESYSGTPESITSALGTFATNPKLFFAVARSEYAGNLLGELLSRLVRQSITTARRYVVGKRGVGVGVVIYSVLVAGCSVGVSI